MGNSLHNKIYLGRRTALFNAKRMRAAGILTAVLGGAAVLMMAAVIR